MLTSTFPLNAFTVKIQAFLFKWKCPQNPNSGKDQTKESAQKSVITLHQIKKSEVPLVFTYNATSLSLLCKKNQFFCAAN